MKGRGAPEEVVRVSSVDMAEVGENSTVARATANILNLFKQSPADELLPQYGSEESLILGEIRDEVRALREELRTRTKEADPLLLTLDQAAAKIGISRSSLENLITVKVRTGKPRLRTVREPGTRIVRVALSDAIAYVEKLRAESR